MGHKVSIIVPVYNAATFLQKTIRSILNQGYSNLEIILVNDCSNDDSLSIMNRLAQEDKRIIIIDKKQNEGEDYARFSGIEVATGDYITFLDADDWFTENAIELLVSIAVDKNVDIVYATKWRVYSAKLGLKRRDLLNNKYCNRVISGHEKENLFISWFGVNILPVTMWCVLFKKDLFKKDLKRSGLKFGADMALSMQLYHNANSFYMTDTPIIFYRWGGVTCKFQPNFLPASKILFQRKMEFINNLGFEQGKRTAIIELINCLSSHIIQLAEYYPKQEEQNIEGLEREIKDPIYSCFRYVANDSYFIDGALNTLCMKLDIRKAYALAAAKTSTPKAKFRFCLKKSASFLLKYIRL